MGKYPPSESWPGLGAPQREAENIWDIRSQVLQDVLQGKPSYIFHLDELRISLMDEEVFSSPDQVDQTIARSPSVFGRTPHDVIYLKFAQFPHSPVVPAEKPEAWDWSKGTGYCWSIRDLGTGEILESAQKYTSIERAKQGVNAVCRKRAVYSSGPMIITIHDEPPSWGFLSKERKALYEETYRR